MLYKLLSKVHNWSLYKLGFGNPDINTNGETKVLKYVNGRYKEKITVFDVGANVGDYTRAVLENIKHGEVYLFEPQKELYDQLSKNFRNCFHFGFSDREEILPIYGHRDKKGLASLYRRDLAHQNLSFGEQEKVRLVTIDDFCEKRGITKIHLLKLDVEGHELKVLRGAGRMLANIDMIQFEFGGCDVDSRTFFRDFWNLLSGRYDIYRVTGGGLRKIEKYAEKEEIFMTSNYLAVKR